jgi:hypothetical protein
MLTHLRQRVERILAQSSRATLSTWGPADIQTSEFECQARGIRLYLRIPRSSDHLFNLEYHDTVVVSTAEWQVRGQARILADEDATPDLVVGPGERGPWTCVVEVTPRRIQIAGTDASQGDTIDMEE